MDNDNATECYVCRKHRGEISIPGGVIYEDDLVFISHAQLWGDEEEHYLGHMFVETVRHVPELADLTEDEAQAIGLYTSRLAQALIKTQGVEHVYSFFIGDGVPHVTFMSLADIPERHRSIGDQKWMKGQDAERRGRGNRSGF